jgi:hypothetical protein
MVAKYYSPLTNFFGEVAKYDRRMKIRKTINK